MDSCMHTAAAKMMSRDPPSCVIGYHWGGAIATYMLEHRLCGSMLEIMN